LYTSTTKPGGKLKNNELPNLGFPACKEILGAADTQKG